jgi:hypothetical protein
MSFLCRRSMVVAFLLGALLTGCAERATLPVQGIGSDVIRSAAGVGRDSTPPACKGQKTTKDYAQAKALSINSKGGVACVPKFTEWGGSMKYPGFSGSRITMTVISSTTAYDPGAFPPYTDALFYLQLKFNAAMKFSSTLQAGATLAGVELKLNQTYTIEGARAMGSLWDVLPGCYTKATKGKYGAMIGGLGYPLKGGDFNSYEDAVVMVYAGRISGINAKC